MQKSLVTDNENISLFKKSYNMQDEIKRFAGMNKLTQALF